ncbi:glycoside hydrolase family 95 protein [Trichoderma barbatum]
MNSDTSQSRHLRIHYTAPATEWSEALPIGNGRLGAVVYGRTEVELIQLNENSVWYGGPQERTPTHAHRMLPELRQLIREGKHSETEALVKECFFATPASMRHYEPMGTATLEFNHKNITDYRRCLDLATSQVSIQYSVDGISFQRDVIASFPDNALLLRFTASKSTRFIVRLDRLSDNETDTNVYADTIKAFGSHILVHATPGGFNSNRLCSVLGIVCDDGGTIEAIGNCLVVNSASCRIGIAAQTTFRHANPEVVALTQIDQALTRTWDQLVERHRADYSRLFGRMSLRMWPDACNLSTDQRLRDCRDPGLVALYHNYGRYLLISCSRNDYKGLPATLQGIWNPSFAPPWGSKYTININLQMNYWPAAPCSLIDDCSIPVVDLLERMSVRGRYTAQVMYGCRGWCAHHNTDIWADTSPQDRWMPATIWPLGGLWLSTTLMDTLKYQYDKALHDRLFNVHEVTNPSLSPENTFVSKSGNKGIFCEGSTMDMTLIKVALSQFIWSLERLSNVSHPLKGPVETALTRIQPLTLNQAGVIQEWGLNDYEEAEPGHRHVSHLFGLYPADLIHPVHSPELAAAAQKVLKRRLANGGGHTGWSRAWLLNFYARLLDAEACGENMDLLLKNSTLPNLLDTHPPFQIDGNFGACAGIVECLVQSTERRMDGENVVQITLLPACPTKWERGHLERVRAKQGWLVSFQWSKNQIIGSVALSCTMAGADAAHVLCPDGSRQVIKGKIVRDHTFQVA